MCIAHLRVSVLVHIWHIYYFFSCSCGEFMCVCVCLCSHKAQVFPQCVGGPAEARLAMTDGSLNASFTDPLQTKLCKCKSTRCPWLKSRTVTMSARSEACQPHWGSPQRTLYLTQVVIALLPPIALEELQNTDITTRPLAKSPKTATVQSYVITLDAFAWEFSIFAPASGSSSPSVLLRGLDIRL